MAITFYSEGAAREVTGSKHVLEVDGKRYLVDCGAFQGKRDESDRKNRALVPDPASIEAVILTHAHFDHCGMLPLLAKRGFEGNIYATPATRDLANLIMMDSARIQARDAEYLGKQAAKRGERFDWKPLYDEQDAVKATEQFVTIAYDRPLPLGDVKLRFRDAGHILGSATAHLTVKDEGGRVLRIGFSGDLGRPDKAIIRDPEPMEPVDFLVLESTYGNRLHEPADAALDKLARVIRETAERGGKVIIPAFAIERTQEIIYHLHLLSEEGKIPPVPIWVDSPMAINATSIFQVHPECYDEATNEAFLKHHKNPFGFNQLDFSRTVEQSKALNALKGPAVIISADGMCEAGRIQHHLIHNIGDERNTVMIVGYMASDTLGRRILDGQKQVRIQGQPFTVKARVEKINAFSAHADYEETWAWLSTMDLSQLKALFLVHGEDDALQGLKTYLEGKGLRDVRIVEYGQRYEL